MNNPLSDPDIRSDLARLRQQVRDLERRRTPGRRGAAVRSLADLHDVDVAGASEGEVLAYDGDANRWGRGSAGPTHPAIGSPSYSGTFGVSTIAFEFEFQHEVIVPTMSVVRVTVTARVTDGCVVEVNETPSILLPASWNLLAHDYTADPTAAYLTGASGSGPGMAQCTVLCANNTDEAVANNIVSAVRSLDSAYDFTADVEVTYRYGFYNL